MSIKEIRHPDLSTSCIMVIDMQEYFRGIATEIIPNLQQLLRTLREKSVPIIYTQHGHEDPSVDGGMLGKWWEDHILKDTEEWELLSELAPHDGELVVHKKRYSAFLDTKLEEHLRKTGINTIIIAGVMTNLCCETNARDAFNRDFRIFFLSDGTATSSIEFHEATLMNIEFGFGTVIKCNEVVKPKS